MQANTDRLLRDTDAAALLACSRSTFWRRVADGTLPRPIRLGGISRWRAADIALAVSQAEEKRGA